MKTRNIVLLSFMRMFILLLQLLLIVFIFMEVSFRISENNSFVWSPNYEQIDIRSLLSKEELSDEDYKTLYEQTGLTKIGIDRTLEHGELGRSRVLTCTDYIKEYVRNTYLEDGDIIVTASTHLGSIRIGHAALVVDGENEEILEAAAYGETSSIATVDGFNNRINFLVLRPKASKELKNEVVNYAKNSLVDIPYSAFSSSFTDSIRKTQCAHIVWYAYHKFDFELLKNDKLIVLPYDLASSEEVEVVQTFGFDPNVLWDSLYK
ncbi:MAG: hypothetical protein BHW12_08945 [Coprobacillus sp. 28_7]|nr:MAG: hypothetical protein BHW12_08945 [Coprobacillus sp. 28_7]